MAIHNDEWNFGEMRGNVEGRFDLVGNWQQDEIWLSDTTFDETRAVAIHTIYNKANQAVARFIVQRPAEAARMHTVRWDMSVISLIDVNGNWLFFLQVTTRILTVGGNWKTKRSAFYGAATQFAPGRYERPSVVPAKFFPVSLVYIPEDGHLSITGENGEIAVRTGPELTDYAEIGRAGEASAEGILSLPGGSAGRKNDYSTVARFRSVASTMQALLALRERKTVRFFAKNDIPFRMSVFDPEHKNQKIYRDVYMDRPELSPVDEQTDQYDITEAVVPWLSAD